MSISIDTENMDVNEVNELVKESIKIMDSINGIEKLIIRKGDDDYEIIYRDWYLIQWMVYK